MESEYILIVLLMCAHLSKIIVIKHHKLTGKKLKWGIMAIIVKQATLAVGNFGLIWQSCSEVVATLVIHIINQIMNG
jgi:hypothetical protein